MFGAVVDEQNESDVERRGRVPAAVRPAGAAG
ncbi:hypothetical protein J2S55_005947 [Streptosporangium brasiliense]|uniref:Uncharacterized protein n=1 Tax=Streptosporangium brasiliense TaxID=47480 RepID=A0ABT9RBQ0_9ACTN|nr:hypothetical protein [Streptosporangium brasiliense]